MSTPPLPPPPPEDSAFSFLTKASAAAPANASGAAPSDEAPAMEVTEANEITEVNEVTEGEGLALDLAVGDRKKAKPEKAKPEKKKRINNDKLLWMGIGGGGVAVLLLLIVAAVMYWPRGESERQVRAAVPGAPLAEESPPAAPKQLDDLGAGARSSFGALGLVKDTVNQKAAAFDNAALDGDTLAGLGRKRDERVGDAPVAREAVPKAQRWEIRWPPTSTEVYAQQLDFFGIELAAVGGGVETIDYGTRLGEKQPVLRKQPAGTPDNRLYFAHRSNSSRLDVDRSLLSSAGIDTNNRVILQFLPLKVEEQLTKLEREFVGAKKLEDILKTIFGVRQGGQGFEFYVIEQRMRGSS